MADILHFFGQTHATYLHARGKAATSALIASLDCQPGETVLEIGCGTGATLVQLASMYRKTQFWGVEHAPVMLKKARQRLRFCLLGKRVQVKIMEQPLHIPFNNQVFDKVYLESVLAIQEGDRLKHLLREIHRVLKPEGILVMNETIWLDTTPLDRISEVNTATKAAFGIIQSNASYPYPRDWEQLFRELGFTVFAVQPLDAIVVPAVSTFQFPYSLLSFVFTALGKLKVLYNRKYKTAWRTYREQMEQIIPGTQKLMKGVLIRVAKRPSENSETEELQ